MSSSEQNVAAYVGLEMKLKATSKTQSAAHHLQGATTMIDRQSQKKLAGSNRNRNNTSSSKLISNINKWSHNIHQNKMPRFRRPQLHSSQQQCGTINLLLPILIGLMLAAIHSSAFTGAGGQSSSSATPSSASHSPPPPSSSSASSASSSSSSSSLGHHPQQSAGSQQASSGSSHGAASSNNFVHTLQPTSKPSINLNESPTINLIPIDQPVLNSNTGSLTSSTAESLAGGGGGGGPGSSSSNLSLKDSYDGSSLHLRSGLSAAMSGSSESSSSGAGQQGVQQDSTLSDDFGGQAQQIQQQQQSINDDEFSEPIAQYYATTNQNEGSSSAYQTNVEQQQVQQDSGPAAPTGSSNKSPVLKSGLVSPRQVERRFGLFKKGHHHQQQQHYGQPASYISSPFMSECERCFAGLGQQTADLQLEPSPPQSLPPPPPMPQPSLPPATLPPLMGGSTGAHFPMQPFAPFKNKFFMKFPFLMKPSFDSLHSSSYSSGPSAAHYWPVTAAQPIYHHHHHQSSGGSGLRPSAMNQALFIRPAPAYNCIQASPSMLAAAASTTSQSEIIPLSGPSKTSPLVATKSQQQQHYAHQQQVQSGYAK